MFGGALKKPLKIFRLGSQEEVELKNVQSRQNFKNSFLSGVVRCVMSEKCLKLKVFAKIDFIAFLASLGVK